MKVDTTNYLSLPFILSNKKPRLIIITGKGGVGKTTLAMAITKAYESVGKKVLYNCFDQPLNNSLSRNLNLPHFLLKMEDSAKEYIANKLGSETIAGWILKTPFFSSLFNMLPGLGHMILLGHIINKLEEDPELTIVLDSPSSGHALTMFESPQNFKEMFRSGLIVEDIKRMEDFIFKADQMKVVITALPTEMALQEAQDLELALKQRRVHDITHVVNDLLKICPSLEGSTSDELPDFLNKKISMEEELLKNLDSSWRLIPHYTHDKPSSIIKECSLLLTKEMHDS
ncbi:MAG: AAA family ATPase [Bacteriovoracaceae bacterium]|nr:AAA family ATPase [Bacteriovoracaceae bacterium]